MKNSFVKFPYSLYQLRKEKQLSAGSVDILLSILKKINDSDSKIFKSEIVDDLDLKKHSWDKYTKELINADLIEKKRNNSNQIYICTNKLNKILALCTV